MADLRENMTDNSAKDGTNDEINGAEVDANPNKIADVLDGSDAVALNQDGSLAIRNFEVNNITNWTGSTINQGLRIRHDPAGGTANDTDGIKLTFRAITTKPRLKRLTTASWSVTSPIRRMGRKMVSWSSR